MTEIMLKIPKNRYKREQEKVDYDLLRALTNAEVEAVVTLYGKHEGSGLIGIIVGFFAAIPFWLLVGWFIWG